MGAHWKLDLELSWGNDTWSSFKRKTDNGHTKLNLFKHDNPSANSFRALTNRVNSAKEGVKTSVQQVKDLLIFP